MRMFIWAAPSVLLLLCLTFFWSDAMGSAAAQSSHSSQEQEEAKDRGIGPVKWVKLGEIDEKLVSGGKEIFQTQCSVCHDLKQKKMGPPLGNVAKERSPEFIMNLILNTSTMENKDPIARKLVSQYGMRMPDMGLDREQARMLLEYFRSVASKD
jgi:cytochrome c